MLKKTIFLHCTIYSIMKETFDSVWGSVKDRFTNPFLGTFLFVWIVRNWSLVYGLFIFDKACDMIYKLNYVKEHFKNYRVLEEFKINLLWTLGIVVLVYLSLAMFQYITNFYQLGIKKINSRFDKINIESKTHYIKLNNQFKVITDKYEKLTLENNELITDLHIKETEVLDLKAKQLDFSLTIKHSIKSYLNIFPYINLIDPRIDDALLHLEHHNFIESSKKWIEESDLQQLFKERLALMFTFPPYGTKLCKYLEVLYLNHLLINDELEEIKKEHYKSRKEKLEKESSDIQPKEIEYFNDIVNLFGLFTREHRKLATSSGSLILRELFGY